MSNTISGSAVLSTAPAAPEVAAAHFAARLSFEADVSDVHADLAAGSRAWWWSTPGRWRPGTWATCRGAVHLPTSGDRRARRD